ncbi:MAG: hypothetical protein MUO26_01920 [Methanotrichaceae archaeon]|nr:hypothetical protein [Methanotrichaceae archaeon]
MASEFVISLEQSVEKYRSLAKAKKICVDVEDGHVRLGLDDLLRICRPESPLLLQYSAGWLPLGS